MKPYMLGPGEGRTFNYGIDHVLKSGELDPGRGCAFMTYVTRKGEEPPDHTHPTEDELFYVLRGEVTFHCGGEFFEASQGSFVYLPQGIEHGYTIKSDVDVELLVVTFPTREAAGVGWGGYVADVERDGQSVPTRPST